MTTVSPIQTADFLFPMDNQIKICGTRYYKGSRNGQRFFPLSKKDFNKLNQADFEIWQKIGNEFVKIN